MVQVNLRLMLLLAAIGAALYVFSRFYRPNTWAARTLERLLLGLALLLCWNGVFSVQHLGVNLLSMYTAGALGLPGACLLLVLRLL